MSEKYFLHTYCMGYHVPVYYPCRAGPDTFPPSLQKSTRQTGRKKEHMEGTKTTKKTTAAAKTTKTKTRRTTTPADRAAAAQAAMDTAKAKAAAALSKEVDTKAAAKAAADADAAAAKAAAKAAAARMEWKRAKATAEETEDPQDTARARALYTLTKKLRAEAEDADDAATAAHDRMDDAARTVDRFTHGRALCIVYRVKTEEDHAAEEAAAAWRAGRMAAATTPEDLKKMEEAYREAAKAAKAAAATAPTVYTLTAPPSLHFDRPAVDIITAHAYADRIAAYLPMLSDEVARTSILWNVLEDRDLITPAARAIARRTAKNAVQRQGTPTQWRIDAAAAMGRWMEDQDLYDMVGSAAEALTVATASEDAAAKEAAAAALLHKTAATLRHIGEGDRKARAVVVDRAAVASAAYTVDSKVDPRTTSDPRKLDARAAVVDMTMEGRALYEAGNVAAALDRITRAAFRAINNSLGDMRAIREDATAPALSLDAIADTIADPRSIDADAVTEYEARRRETIRAALPVALEAMTPVQVNTLKVLYRKGGSVRGTARAMRRNERAIWEHRARIARAVAYAVHEVAPGSIEESGLDLAAAAADMENTAARAEVAATVARKRAAASLEAAAQQVAAAEVAAAVAEAVNALPPVMRETARLLGAGMSKKEAARRIGKHKSTVQEAARIAAARIAAAIAAADPALAPAAQAAAEAADLRALLAIITAA